MFAKDDTIMKLRKHIILFCLITAIEIPFNHILSQSIQSKPTRQSSLEAFSLGNYEKAYSEFRELLITYTKDPLYKYYSGVCLVKLNRDPDEATKLLSDAVQSTGVIKTLPSDGLFYLGRAQQMSGKFSEAAGSYKSYTDLVGKKTAKEMRVPDLIQQCNDKTGQIAVSEVKPVAATEIKKQEIIKPEPVKTISDPVLSITSAVTTSKENLPPNYERILREAVELQFKADSVTDIVNNQKKDLNKLSEFEKSAMRAKILQNEKIAASFQAKADQKAREAELAMNPIQDSVIPSRQAALQTEYKVNKDTIKKAENVVAKTPERKSEPANVIIPVLKNQADIFSLFEVVSQPATDPRAKLIIDSEVPAGLIYRIQIAVFRNPVTPAFFKGLSPVYGFKIAATDKTIYYAGMFRKNSDAVKALSTVKAKGFKDAFIVGLMANKSVSADRSALLEKEWGNKPLFAGNRTQTEARSDTITPTLTFRVEVTRTLKPLKDDVLDGMKKMAGSRGLDIVTLEDGKIDYLIGKFITFETASEYSDLLKRNGYRDAQVVAWLGTKEIPIETARQLFDKLK
jgi:hypothetical protein